LSGGAAPRVNPKKSRDPGPARRGKLAVVRRFAMAVSLVLAGGCARADRPVVATPVETTKAAASTTAEGPWEAALEASWQAAGVRPVARADDATLLRRATIDLLGRIPTVEEIDAFTRDRSGDRFTRAVDRMLDDPAWADAWADSTVEVLLAGADPKAVRAVQDGLREWMARQLRAGTPWDLI